MNSKVLATTILILGLLGSGVFAQPFVRLPQGDFSCTVTVTSRQAMPPAITKVEITRVGDLRRNVISWSDNSVSEVWTMAQTGLSVSEENDGDGKKSIYVLQGAMRDSAIPSVLQLDSASTAWIEPKNLVGNPNATSGTLHYKRERVLPRIEEFVDAPNQPDQIQIYQAWIDAKTLLPLKLDDGQAEYNLSFAKEVPTGPLVLPPKLKAELDRWQAAITPGPRL